MELDLTKYQIVVRVIHTINTMHLHRPEYFIDEETRASYIIIRIEKFYTDGKDIRLSGVYVTKDFMPEKCDMWVCDHRAKDATFKHLMSKLLSYKCENIYTLLLESFNKLSNEIIKSYK